MNNQLREKGNNNFFTFQSDFVTPLSENTKFEAGLRGAIRNVQSENLNYIQNPITGDLLPFAAINANYKYKDQVLAAYSTLSGKVGKNFTYLAGLRMKAQITVEHSLPMIPVSAILFH